jgi:rubrerythrin
MPVYIIKCPDCEHQFKGLVMTNTQAPKEWVCSVCGSHQAKPVFQYSNGHPLENSHGAGCPCCGGNVSK